MQLSSQKLQRMKLFVIWLAVPFVLFVSDAAILSFPSLANCGDQAVLTCTSTKCNHGYIFRRDEVTIYNHGGPLTGADPARYSAIVTSQSQVLLTITNIQLSDAGAYKCNCEFDALSVEQTLGYECRASVSPTKVTSVKTLQITVDNLYPQPFNIVTYLNSSTSPLPGTYTCESSPTHAYHYTCTWNSKASLPDGNHSYTIMVTTETQASVTGTFRIVTPASPSISNLVNISNNRQVVRGVQDTLLTIQCVSMRGIPAPTLAWYRDNTSTSPLDQSTTSDSVQQSDGTYTVTLIHMFTPGRRDDMRTYLCQVLYPGASNESSPDPGPALALLYLDLKPDNTTVSQTGEAISGGNMTLRCTSINGRPAPSITWSYRGKTYTPTSSLSLDPMSETYTMVSVLQRPVSAVDNGQAVTCMVSHTTLSAPLNATVNVDVKYPPTVTVSANTSLPYTITCTAEGYPTSYRYQDWEQIWPGYGPVATIPFNGTTLTLTNNTYERSGMYVCRVSNGIAVYGTNVEYMEGNASLIIKAPPVLIYPSPGGPRVLVTGRLGQNATIKIRYWSNLKDSAVRCCKLVNGLRSSSSNCSIKETSTEVILPVYHHPVKERGTLATLTIPINSKEDLTDYDIVVTNSVPGESVLGIVLVPQDEDSPPVESQTALISVIVTGVCVLLVITVVMLIICWRRKAGCNKTTENERRNLGNTNASSGSVVECAMYESAGHVQQRTPIDDLYSKPKKKDQAVLKAAPVKHKKGSPYVSSKVNEKLGKSSKELSKSAKQADKRVYEYPEARASFGPSMPKKKINKDGLVYADLEFNNSPKKSTIHGLDNATTYVQVDFTKVADPMPECDEETYPE